MAPRRVVIRSGGQGQRSVDVGSIVPFEMTKLIAAFGKGDSEGHERMWATWDQIFVERPGYVVVDQRIRYTGQKVFLLPLFEGTVVSFGANVQEFHVGQRVVVTREERRGIGGQYIYYANEVMMWQ